MKEKYLILIAAVGIALGLGASLFTQSSGNSYCQSIEQDLQQNRSFNGSIACYPPGMLDANVSERVDKNTEHRCTCRIIDRSGIRLFPIAVSN